MDTELEQLFLKSQPLKLPTVEISEDFKKGVLAKLEEDKQNSAKEKKRKRQDIEDSNTELDTKEEENNRSEKKKIAEQDLEKEKRTVFVGNVNVKVLDKITYKEFLNIFQKYGKVESCRFRSIAFSEPLNRKMAFKRKLLHPERDSLNAYVVLDTVEAAKAALKENGSTFEEKHLRVDLAGSKANCDKKKSIFVGNLSFDVAEESLWEHFKSCGEIVNVRVIRDSKTNVGKGFGYVEFKDKSSIIPAIKLHESEMKGRKLRVSRCENSKKEKLKKVETNASKKQKAVQSLKKKNKKMAEFRLLKKTLKSK